MGCGPSNSRGAPRELPDPVQGQQLSAGGMLQDVPGSVRGGQHSGSARRILNYLSLRRQGSTSVQNATPAVSQPQQQNPPLTQQSPAAPSQQGQSGSAGPESQQRQPAGPPYVRNATIATSRSTQRTSPRDARPRGNLPSSSSAP